MQTKVGGWADGQMGGARGVFSALRRLFGMPDYPAYVEHLRQCHPERAVPSEREFFEEFVRDRYGSGATRCC